MAGLPQDGSSRSVRTDHPLYYLLRTQTSPWQTSYEFRETLMVHLTLCGNAYAWRTKVLGVDQEMILLPPSRVRPKRLADGDMQYTYHLGRRATVDVDGTMSGIRA